MHGASNSIPDPVVGTGVETVEPENNEYRQAEHALPDLIESLIENTSSLEELVISSSSCVREQVSTTENDFVASFSSDEEIEFDSDVIARFVQEEDEPSTAEPTTVLSLKVKKFGRPRGCGELRKLGIYSGSSSISLDSSRSMRQRKKLPEAESSADPDEPIAGPSVDCLVTSAILKKRVSFKYYNTASFFITVCVIYFLLGELHKM